MFFWKKNNFFYLHFDCLSLYIYLFIPFFIFIFFYDLCFFLHLFFLIYYIKIKEMMFYFSNDNIILIFYYVKN
jgi:hypothetical protein